jgi:hypothetical protein
MKVGDDGESFRELWYEDSTDVTELGYRRWPRVEKVGVTGEGISDAEALCAFQDDERSASASDILSLRLRSSTNCGSKRGLSLGDMAAQVSVSPFLNTKKKKSIAFASGVLRAE